MTEEQQAQMLAQWLENPSRPPPEGLDPEVIEALGVLRPDWVPTPRVTAEAILNTLGTDAPVIDLKRHRAARIPGWNLIGGLSGAGAMAAAAIALFALFPASSWKSANLEKSAPEAALEAVPVEGRVEASSEPHEALAALDDANDEGKEDLTAASVPPVPKPPPQAISARSAAPPEAEAPAEDALIMTTPAPAKASEVDRARSEVSGGPLPSMRTPMRPTPKQKARTNPREEERFTAMASEAEMDEPLPLDTLRSRVLVHLGPMPEAREGASPDTVWIANAKSALDAGHHELAEQHGLHGLSLGSGPTAERRWLTFIVGEARRMRGDEEAARMRFEAALRGEVD